jgi:hypothetical protein
MQCSLKHQLGYTLLNVDHLFFDVFSFQKHFQSPLTLVLDILVVPRTETLAVDWLQLTEQGATLIHPLGCSVTEHPLKGINVLVSLILFMKHGLTNTTLLAFSVTKLQS